VFGNLFTNEPLPIDGKIDISVLNKPGFGLELNPDVVLIPDDEVIKY